MTLWIVVTWFQVRTRSSVVPSVTLSQTSWSENCPEVHLGSLSYYPEVSEDSLRPLPGSSLSAPPSLPQEAQRHPISRQPRLPRAPPARVAKLITQRRGSGAQSWRGFQGSEIVPGGPQGPGSCASYEQVFFLLILKGPDWPPGWRPRNGLVSLSHALDGALAN